MPLPSFDAVADKFVPGEDAPKSSLEVFTLLCEEIVDHVADMLEHLAGELNGLSIDVFRADDTRGRHAARANHVLRVQLRQVGRLGDRFSEVRDGMQGLGRSSPIQNSMPANGPTARSSRASPVCARTSIR